jgi:hypothetical protein
MSVAVKSPALGLVYDETRGGNNISLIEDVIIAGPFGGCVPGSPGLCAFWGPDELAEYSLDLSTGQAKFKAENPLGFLDVLRFTVWDVLLVSVPGASPTTETTITVRHELDGAITQAANATSGYQFADTFCVGSCSSTIQNLLVDLYPQAGQISSVSYSGQQGNFVDPARANPSLGIYGWDGDYEVEASVTFWGAFAAIQVLSTWNLIQGRDITSIDFGNTSAIEVGLPAGVTATSGSGLFLTRDPAAANGTVPEPGTLALLAGGLIAACGVRRKRITTSPSPDA